mmetsp:Transcript_29835/g.28531  ORF Transcript_29835/g.28531 Transcript_29835/m.28531 type:complete len:281 (+) Transcript_29835:3-845(+)
MMIYFYFIYLSFYWANITLSFNIFEEVSLFVVDKNRTVPISLVVPTILMEIKCLGQFLRSLELSTFFPTESIIVASGDRRNESEVYFLKSMIKNALVPDLKLILLNGRYIQASSRNIGANVSSQPFISFFDGDDYLHPQRFEILSKLILKNPAVHLFLHMFENFTTELPIIRNIDSVNILLSPFEITQTYKTKLIEANKGNPNGLRYFQWLYPDHASIHNAHNTMERKVWLAIPQNTALNFYRSEDSHQNSEIVKAGFNVIVIDTTLSFYRLPVNKIKIC